MVQVTSLGAAAVLVLTVTSVAQDPPTAQPPLAAIWTDFTSPEEAGPKLGGPLGFGAGVGVGGALVGAGLAAGVGVWAAVGVPPPLASSLRSEEHTSELQSPYDLVCRLL